MRKGAIKKQKRSGKLRYGVPEEMAAKMDAAYLGALDVIKRAGVVKVIDEVKVAPAVASGPLAAKAKQLEGKGKCEVIRTLALAFPDASVAQIRAALPGVNPSTVAIQVRKARVA